MKNVDLVTMQRGVVIDMFNEEFEKVLNNIADDNVEPDAVRDITIKLQIKPDKTRKTAATKVDVNSKLAPVKSSDGMLFIGMEENKPVAYEDDCRQEDLQDASGASIFKMARAGGEK